MNSIFLKIETTFTFSFELLNVVMFTDRCNPFWRSHGDRCWLNAYGCQCGCWGCFPKDRIILLLGLFCLCPILAKDLDVSREKRIYERLLPESWMATCLKKKNNLFSGRKESSYHLTYLPSYSRYFGSVKPLWYSVASIYRAVLNSFPPDGPLLFFHVM